MLLTFNNPISGQTDRLNDPRISERIWNSFLSTFVDQDTSMRQRYRRVCPELFSKLPKFDDVSKLEDVEREAQAVLRHNTDELVEIAHRLVASTFFFEKDMASVKQKSSGLTCTGSFLLHLYPFIPFCPTSYGIAKNIPRVNILQVPSGFAGDQGSGLVPHLAPRR